MTKILCSKTLLKLTVFLVIIICFFFVYSSSVSALDYKFPWGSGVDWQYLQGWHCNAYNCALDVGVGSEDSYKNALISADGTVSKVCDDGTSYYINVNNTDGTMGYFHVLNGTLEPSIAKDQAVKQGQFIGKLKTGSWSPDPGCGYASQNSSTGHIHWTFNTSLTYLVDGWTFTYPTNTMTDANNNHKYVLDSLHSTNTMILRNETITSSKTYETTGAIILRGDGNGLYLSPTSGNIISIISH